jgi:hypothetical protein
MYLQFNKRYSFILLTGLLLINLFTAYPQKEERTGTISGSIRDKNTQEILIGATVSLEGTSLGVSADVDGNFSLKNVPVKSYNVRVSFVGYKPLIRYNVSITSGNANIINFELDPETSQLQEVKVTADKARVANEVTPLSVQKLTVEEIRANPGGNFDISKVIQALPGVGGTSGGGGFRNDIIIRGGAPNENVFYLDGVEVPVINHFATQGSSGGPVGILNVSFIEDVTLSSSSFDARYDNALSSVLQFKQRNGNSEKAQGNIRLGASETAATLEGPLSKDGKWTHLSSMRRSYLQLLFKAIDLPFLPDYWDFQYKITGKLSPKTTFTALGLGAIDNFGFRTPRNSTPENTYILRSLSSIKQWNNTTGFSLRHLLPKGYWNLALSANRLDNNIDKFYDNEEGNEAKRQLKIYSTEAEHKLRFDFNKFVGGWKYNFGGMIQQNRYRNETFNRLRQEIKDAKGNILQPEIVVNIPQNGIDFWRYGIFGQVSHTYFNDKLNTSFGIRSDMNSFTTDGGNPIETLSPRANISYALTENINLNASIGRYFKIPPYTILGFRDNNGKLENKNAKYIQSNHYVAGIEWLPRKGTRITLEAFDKIYSNYPVSVRDGISLANQGGDFNVLGNEAVTTDGKGRSYGFELFLQQKLTGNLFAVFSYTWFKSEFSGKDGKLIPTAWDNTNLISFVGGYKLPRNWELGVKYRYQGGAPYTPFDLVASQRNYLTLGTGVLDYRQLNTQRLASFNAMDVRVDKKWNYKKSLLDFYIDFTNVLQAKNPSYPNYTFKQNADATGFASTDGQPVKTDGSNAIPFILNNPNGAGVPTIGLIYEF